MPLSYSRAMVGRESEWARLAEFVTSGEPTATLGIAWGRRRVGKSFLLETASQQLSGFHYCAVRGSSGEALRDFGTRMAAYSGAVAPYAFEDWDSAIVALLALGRDRETLVVLDEFPYLLEHTPSLDSIIQRAFGTRATNSARTQTRLILCGSAMRVMSKLLTGTAPLRGRAGLDLRVMPFDVRTTRALHRIDDLATAFRTYAVIGGVAAYAREMVANDLPSSASTFDRWICHRILSPAAPLFNEIELLLSEDPATSKARKINIYHAVLAGVASGNHAHQSLTKYVKISGASLAPVIDSLLATDLIVKVEDPLRDNRPTYHPSDSLLRFHYALTRKHGARLSAHGADTPRIWKGLVPTFESLVLGPAFEAESRRWAQTVASRTTLGGDAAHVGPTNLAMPGGAEMQLDVVVTDAEGPPGRRRVYAIGEAKAGERITMRHVKRLEDARAAIGSRAVNAKLLLFGSRVGPDVYAAATQRSDIEIVDLERLYYGD